MKKVGKAIGEKKALRSPSAQSVQNRSFVIRLYVSLVVFAVASIASTINAAVQGGNVGIPFLLWVGTLGFGVILLAGRASARLAARESQPLQEQDSPGARPGANVERSD